MRLSVHKYINLWKAFFSNSLTRDMEFKANFIAGLTIDLMYYTCLYLFYHVIFQFTDSIGSFSKGEIIAAGVLLYYLKLTQCGKTPFLSMIKSETMNEFLEIKFIGPPIL